MSITNVNSMLINGYQHISQSGKAGTTQDSGFTEKLSEAARTKNAGVSFQDMWQARFSGAYYHVIDASKIQQGVWERHDFPFEAFFQNDLNRSIVDWKPNGTAPKLTDDAVQTRLHSIAGQKSVVVPPELEEKMKNDPELAQQVMGTVENFVAQNQVPGRICSHLIVLDENGKIAHYRASSHGGNLVGPTEKERRQFEAEQAAKARRRARNVQLAKEAAFKRAEMESRLRQQDMKQAP